MKSRYLIAVGAVALAMGGLALAQYEKVPPGKLPNPNVPPGPVPPSPALIPQPSTPPVVETKPEDMTIEQLLDAVDKFREQKAEIEKKEKAYMKVVHQKAEKLKQQIDNLDGDKTTPPPVISTTGAPQSIPAPGVVPVDALPPAGNP